MKVFLFLSSVLSFFSAQMKGTRSGDIANILILCVSILFAGICLKLDIENWIAVVEVAIIGIQAIRMVYLIREMNRE